MIENLENLIKFSAILCIIPQKYIAHIRNSNLEKWARVPKCAGNHAWLGPCKYHFREKLPLGEFLKHEIISYGIFKKIALAENF